MTQTQEVKRKSESREAQADDLRTPSGKVLKF